MPPSHCLVLSGFPSTPSANVKTFLVTRLNCFDVLMKREEASIPFSDHVIQAFHRWIRDETGYLNSNHVAKILRILIQVKLQPHLS